MVLKEYLLRGMVENVLVLTPASLVGQWREELESKFDITCATTHDGRSAQRSRRLLGREAPDRIAATGAAGRACRPVAGAQLSTSSSWTRPIICATARARATSWWTRSTSDSCSCSRRRPVQNDLTRAVQRAHLAQAGYLQDAEGVSRRLHDGRQAAAARESRATAHVDARCHGAQHACGRGAQAAAPPRSDDQGRGLAGRAVGLPGADGGGAPARGRASEQKPPGGASSARCAPALRQQRLRRRYGGSPSATATMRTGRRWPSAGGPSATAARRSRCSICCDGIQTRRS